MKQTEERIAAALDVLEEAINDRDGNDPAIAEAIALLLNEPDAWHVKQIQDQANAQRKATQDGIALRRDGAPLTVEQTSPCLRALESVREILYLAPELNPSNYDHDQVCQLNDAMCEAWNITVKELNHEGVE